MNESLMPILVGCGQITQREEDPTIALSPMDLTAKACIQAAEDTNIGKKIFNLLDTLVLIRSFSDTSWRFKCPFGSYSNPPKSLANRISANNVNNLIYTFSGGNMPQWTINRLSEKIAEGEIELALIAGGEALNTQKNAQRNKINLNWNEITDNNYGRWGIDKPGWSKVEEIHKMNGAIYAYPMIENAIRGNLGHNIKEHLSYMADLFSKFSLTASLNPLADKKKKFTSKEIGNVSEDNPFIGFPYTKLMNANAFIDQSAAIIITNVAKAKELSIPKNKWVYLHGCADAYDHWFLSDRINYYSSPAMSIVAKEAFEMAKCKIEDIDYLDLYSCFPSAIEIACKEMNIPIDDSRGLTITGGLPYFGGPGNNYVTHSIAEMMNKLRQNPNKKGLITANGNYITKQSVGIYSCKPIEKAFNIKDPQLYQNKIMKNKGPKFINTADGKAFIETYTVMYNKERDPIFSILFGRLKNKKRFIANTINDKNLLKEMTNKDYLKASGKVVNKDSKNIFIPD